MGNKENNESKIMTKLKKLDETSRKIIETHGYTSDAKKLLILKEIVREQLKNENISNSAS